MIFKYKKNLLFSLIKLTYFGDIIWIFGSKEDIMIINQLVAQELLKNECFKTFR